MSIRPLSHLSAIGRLQGDASYHAGFGAAR
jgi:hypothetical protein